MCEQCDICVEYVGLWMAAPFVLDLLQKRVIQKNILPSKYYSGEVLNSLLRYVQKIFSLCEIKLFYRCYLCAQTRSE